MPVAPLSFTTATWKLYSSKTNTLPTLFLYTHSSFRGWKRTNCPTDGELHPDSPRLSDDCSTQSQKGEYLEALHQTDLGPVPGDGAHADIKDIRPFLKYFNDLVATEVYNDVLFVSERNENVWWYDGERIAFRTPNYTKILNAMRTQPTLTLADMKEETGISVTAIQKLLNRLISKKYVERSEKEGSWRVFMTQ